MMGNAGADAGAGAGMGGPIYPPPPRMMPDQHDEPPNNWAANDANTLLVVATLITTLTYQLGTNVPGGYWQQATTTKMLDGKEVHSHAGDPIMRDLHFERYCLFMTASWVGFVGSMLMTLSLLLRMPVNSRHVRWSFAVAYSSLVLTFVVSQSKSRLSLDLLIWALVLANLWVLTSVRQEHLTSVTTTTDPAVGPAGR